MEEKAPRMLERSPFGGSFVTWKRNVEDLHNMGEILIHKINFSILYLYTLTDPCKIDTGKKLAGIELKNKRKSSWTSVEESSFKLKYKTCY